MAATPGEGEAEIDGPSFVLETVDVFGTFSPPPLCCPTKSLCLEHTQRTFVQTPTDVYPNVAMMRAGYLGCAPLQPTVAISLRTLELYRQTHRANPRLSLQAQARAICAIHNVPYRGYLCEQLRITFDVYLDVLDSVTRRVRAALGRDTPNWRMLNTCPACFYTLEDEPKLQYSFLCEMDGNNSLKRTEASLRDQVERIDTRRARSDYWLSPEAVDVFKYEVKGPLTADPAAAVDEDGNNDWQDEDVATECTKRWVNAGPEERKRMWTMFAESGIFLASCRHGSVLLICDMIKSGELAKYPLAVVDKLMEVYGADIACGYDIGCVFSKTLATSSLGPRAAAERFRFVVGSFHGHAHNRGCQLHWHPRYVKGMGQANFEGCERVFGASNALAANSRNATKFHRHQDIEQHFAFWDEDKYANLSRYLVNHYRAALAITTGYPDRIRARQEELGIGDEAFAQYIEAEKAYLAGLQAEPPAETLRFNIATPGLHKAMIAANRAVATKLRKVENKDVQVESLENQLGLTGERWSEESEEYRAVKAQMVERKYRRALDELERLIVQRLFELTKLNMAGYKLRTHIATALKRRSAAIRSALDKYNAQARKLVPPRPVLSWKEVVDYGFLAEFDLLRDARTDVRQEKWAQPAHRDLTLQHLELLRAREELLRCDNEIRRLRTHIRDEAEDYRRAISNTSPSDPALAAEIGRRWDLRRAINIIHERRLADVLKLPGYSGRHDLGVRIGRAAPVDAGSVLESADDAVVSEVLASEADDRQDVEEADVVAFEDFVHDIIS
ncbi:hypothetical protein FA95DRAFT_1502561 [Auriscalpium vulgare]|uniref:Uncharacterized protein n=1 Tax=Auriscalpium vulgare TaxID=40419 RepID=A0ACB8R9P4_9AGAM|nr:hypothetical protein FA95DRAFT_1502561 [Auriscalpium vulgare]